MEKTLTELTLDDITYTWLEKCEDKFKIKKAIKLIEEDGDYFLDLKKTLQKKLSKIDENFINPSAPKKELTFSEKQKEINKIENWQKNLSKNPKNLQTQRSAELEKTKGNEALKSGDYKEALAYYNKAISLDPKKAIYFGNRAFVRLKMKDYKKAIKDSSESVKIDSTYIKGYYRRAKANEFLRNFLNVGMDYLQILKLDPKNKIASEELEKVKRLLNGEENCNLENYRISLLGGVEKGGTVKIEIEECSDESESEDEQVKDRELRDMKLKRKEEGDLGNKGEGNFGNKGERELVINPLLEKVEKDKQVIDEILKKGSYTEAIEKYNKILQIEDLKELNLTLWLSIKSNQSYCYKQLENDKKVITTCTDIIEEIKKMKDFSENKIMSLLIKGLVRRGLSYERSEKYKNALLDFCIVKKFSLSNTKALSGVSRNLKNVKYFDTNFDYQSFLEKVEKNYKKYTPIAKQTQKPLKTPLKISPLQLERIKTLKTQGNAYFKEKIYKQAIQKYTQSLTALNSFKNATPSSKQLQIDILSNRSLANYYQKNYYNGMNDAFEAIKISGDSEKLLYRIVLNSEGLVKELFEQAERGKDLHVCLELFRKVRVFGERGMESAKRILEREENLKVRKGFGNVKRLVDLSLERVCRVEGEIRELEKNDFKGESVVKNVVEKDVEDSKLENFGTIQLKDDLIIKAQNISKKGMINLLENYEKPQNASQFEIDLKCFKEKKELGLEYLMKTDSNLIKKFYSKKQVEISYLLLVIEFFDSKENLEKNYFMKFLEILEIFSESKQFKLTRMMMLKKEKKKVLELFGKIESGFEDRISKLKKVYKIK